jgi:multidrug efflux system membrane fusion protein
MIVILRTVFRSGSLSATFAGLLLLQIILLSGCSNSTVSGNSSASQAQPAVPVTVAAVVQKTVPVQLKAIGNVEAYSTVQVKTRVEGELTKVAFNEGQNVKKGDMLFTIDKRPFEEAIRQLQATIQKDMAQARQAEANVAKDAAQSKNADVEARRYADMFERGIVSKEQNDQFRATAESSNATVNADKAAVAVAQQAVKEDQASLANAQLQLSYCSIRSPIDGRTGNLMVHQGNLIKADDVPLVIIYQLTPVYVTFSVPERELSDIKKYDAEGKLKVEAALSDNQQQSIQGSISFIDSTVDNTTGTIKLKGLFANTDRQLWPGQFVNVVLTLTSEPDALVVPSQAVQSGQSGQYVFVIKPDLTAESRPVVVSRSLDGESVIESGLQPGEKIVTDGQLRLVPGTKVDIKGSTESQQG